MELPLIPMEVKGEFCSLICYEHINKRRIWLVAFVKAFCVTLYQKESEVEENNYTLGSRAFQHTNVV